MNLSINNLHLYQPQKHLHFRDRADDKRHQAEDVTSLRTYCPPLDVAKHNRKYITNGNTTVGFKCQTSVGLCGYGSS